MINSKHDYVRDYSPHSTALRAVPLYNRIIPSIKFVAYGLDRTELRVMKTEYNLRNIHFRDFLYVGSIQRYNFFIIQGHV